MTLLADFESQRVLEHIRSSGLLTEFTDYMGNEQGSTNSCAGLADLTDLPSNERLVQVRLAGNDQVADGSVNITQYPVSIYVIGKTNLDDATTVQGLANDIRNWLRKNFFSSAECITAIQVLGSGGPYPMEDSRPFCEISLIVKFVADTMTIIDPLDNAINNLWPTIDCGQLDPAINDIWPTLDCGQLDPAINDRWPTTNCI